MALIDDYQARINTQLRTNWSNPGNTTATTPNTTLEGLAASDVAGRFLMETAATYDPTNAIHVDTAVFAVALKLQVWTGQVDNSMYENYVDTFKRVGMVLGHDRLTPQTDSLKVRTADTANEKVAADWTKFIGVVPAIPTNSQTVDGSGLNT